MDAGPMIGAAGHPSAPRPAVAAVPPAGPDLSLAGPTLSPAGPAETIPRSVRWHLAHPPADPDQDFSPDDRALAAAEA